MKKNLIPILLIVTLSAPALATAPTAPAQATLPASWNNAQLANSTYYVKDAIVNGNTNVVNAQQLASIVAAMKRDSEGAIKRRYPNATLATDPSAPGVITVQPTLTPPANLLPWSKLSIRYDLQLPGGNVSLIDTFSVMELYTRGSEAMNYAADRLMGKMP